MVKKALFLIIGILILPSFARADLSAESEGESTSAKGDDFTLSGYKAGKNVKGLSTLFALCSGKIYFSKRKVNS